MAVPEWWTTGETQCGAPVEDTVYFDMAATYDCANPPAPSTVREVSALAVLDADSGYGELMVREMAKIGEVDGREIVEREGCEDWFEGVCRRLFAVPSEGVVFAVTIAEDGDGDYEAIRDSLIVLPDSSTTVPLATRDGWTPTWGADPGATDKLVAQLKGAGLTVNIKKIDRGAGDTVGHLASFPEGSLLEVSPVLGSVIETGGTVTVSVSGRSLDPSG